MSLLVVDKTKCKKDGVCVASCPTGCIALDADGYPTDVASELCNKCGHCVAICPHGALTNTNFPPGAFVPVPEAVLDPEAMETLLKSRRSVREFKKAPLSRQELAHLVDVARYAPTARNTQLVGWILADDPAKTRALAEASAAWLRASAYSPALIAAWDAGQEVILRGAPHVVVAHTPGSWDWGAVDASIALTYLELAAASQGIGVCWAGLFTRAIQADPAVAHAVGLPEGHVAHGALMLGRPKYPYRMIPPAIRPG